MLIMLKKHLKDFSQELLYEVKLEKIYNLIVASLCASVIICSQGIKKP